MGGSIEAGPCSPWCLCCTKAWLPHPAPPPACPPVLFTLGGESLPCFLPSLPREVPGAPGTCPACQERWDEPTGTQHSHPGPQKQQQTSSCQHLPSTLGPHPLCPSPPGHGPTADMEVKGLGQWGLAPRVWLPCRLQRPGERSSALGVPKSLSATSGSGEAGKPRDALCAPSGPVTTLSQRAL